jgi:hypothetical protein
MFMDNAEIQNRESKSGTGADFRSRVFSRFSNDRETVRVYPKRLNRDGSELSPNRIRRRPVFLRRVSLTRAPQK